MEANLAERGDEEPAKEGASSRAEDCSDRASLRCTQCTAEFEDVLALLSHLDSHASCCPVCGKEFTSKQFLDHHIKSHPLHGSPEGAARLSSSTVHGEEAGDTLIGQEEEELVTKETGKMETEKQFLNDNLLDKDDVEIHKELNTFNTPQATKSPTETTNADSTIPNMDQASSLIPTRNVFEQSKSQQKEEVIQNGGENGGHAENYLESTNSPSLVSQESGKPRADKPFRCSECRYAAKCVASVHIHQRRQHPGEFTTVISTIDDDTNSSGPEIKPAPTESRGQEESEDEEVRLALQSPLPDSDSGQEEDVEEDGDGEKEVQQYRCSMCDFTAEDTDTVFDHQRTEHPGDWQLTAGQASPDLQEAAQEEEEEEDDDSIEQLFELPTDLDHFSVTGRTIIAGEGTGPQTSLLYPSSTPSSHHLDGQSYSSTTGKFYCSNCPAYFYESGSLRRHHQMCRNTETLNATFAQFRCTLCKRVFPNSAALVPHMLAHQRHFRAFRCSLCGYKGKFEGTIIAHIRHRHPAGPEASVQRVAGQEEINAIPTCWERLGPQGDKADQLEAEEVTDDPDLQQLFGGVALHPARRGATPDRGSPLPNSAGSRQAADTDALSLCSELSEDSWDADSLHHLKLGSNYMCPECPVLFREAHKLKRHLDSHGGVKRHVCQICQKRFTRSEHLKRHRIVHANTKPYMCGTCCYSCKRLDNLQKHQRVKHPGELCEVVRVSKEMIEAEIAANESALGVVPQSTASAPRQPPQPPDPVSRPALPKPMHGLSLMPQSRPAKRGRPRKISSPEDNFLFCRDPGYSPMAALPGSAGRQHPQVPGPGLLNSMTALSSDAMPKLVTLSGNTLDVNHTSENPMLRNYTGPQPSANFYSLPLFGMPSSSSTPIQIPTFEASSISTAAAAAAAAASSLPIGKDIDMELDNLKVEPMDTSQKPSGISAGERYFKPASETDVFAGGEADGGDNSSPIAHANEVSRVLAGLVNRGKYQCHVCDRPFSYLKPFKKHLLCHGTFMPYECSVCGHQAKRRDMVQDHQRDQHPGQACDIRVKEPTSDMHDMMDTYIHQVPDPAASSRPQPTDPAPTTVTLPTTSGEASTLLTDDTAVGISALGPRRVDPQANSHGVDPKPPPGLVKMEPDDCDWTQAQPPPPAHSVGPPPDTKPKHQLPVSSIRTRSQRASLDSTSLPASSKPGQVSAAVKNESDTAEQPIMTRVPSSIGAGARAATAACVGMKAEEERSTSSPVTFSPQTPGSGAGLLRPRPRRLIKFKVLSPHTKAVSKPPAPPLAPTPSSGPGDPAEARSSKDDDHPEVKGDSGTEDGVNTATVTPLIKDQVKSHEESKLDSLTPPLPAPPKRRRLIEKSPKLLPSTDVTEEEEAHGPSPMIGVAPKVPIMGMRTVRPVLAPQEALVINIKSHKGSPKDKQGDNHRFVCSVCDQRFAYEKPFKRHLLVHGGFEPYRCDACGHLTTSRDAMKVHQYKVHQDTKTLGITVLNPTPEMEQNLVRQGLLQQHQPASEEEAEEDGLLTKSIVETARMEQHKLAAAMRSLSATVKALPDDKREEGQDPMSFPQMLGLRPASSANGPLPPEAPADGPSRVTASSSDTAPHQSDDISDMPVDEALFVDAPGTGESAGYEMLSGQEHGGLACQLCQKTFSCANKLQRHLVSHTGIKAYECQICFKKLTRLEHLKRHLLTHGNLKPYRCSGCKFDAKRLDIVQLHQQIEHVGQAVDIVYLFAPSVMLPDPKLAADDGVREDGEFGCHVCGMRFLSMNYLVVHQKVHTTTLKPYECFLCHKTFTRPEHLKRHRLVHDDTKPYRCSSCGFKTKRLDGMREHQRSRHPGTEVFIIDTILPQNPAVKRKRGRPPKLSPRDSLDGLQLLHCDKCCLAFYDQNRFEQHKLTHIPSPTNPAALTCQICGIKVSQIKHLRRHMLLHENHIPYQCSLCGYAARRTDHMKLHFRKQHPFGGAQVLHISKARYAGNAATGTASSTAGGLFIKQEELSEDMAPEDGDAFSMTAEEFFHAYPSAGEDSFMANRHDIEQFKEMTPDTSSELEDAFSGEEGEDWGEGLAANVLDSYPSSTVSACREDSRENMETDPDPGVSGKVGREDMMSKPGAVHHQTDDSKSCNSQEEPPLTVQPGGSSEDGLSLTARPGVGSVDVPPLTVQPGGSGEDGLSLTAGPGVGSVDVPPLTVQPGGSGEDGLSLTAGPGVGSVDKPPLTVQPGGSGEDGLSLTAGPGVGSVDKPPLTVQPGGSGEDGLSLTAGPGVGSVDKPPLTVQPGGSGEDGLSLTAEPGVGNVDEPPPGV